MDVFEWKGRGMSNNPIDNQKAPISEEAYESFPLGFKNWIEQDLKWKREDIASFYIRYETLKNGYTIGEDGKKWARHKYGNHADVTIERITQEKYIARFERLNDGSWKKKDEYDVSPMARKESR